MSSCWTKTRSLDETVQTSATDHVYRNCNCQQRQWLGNECDNDEVITGYTNDDQALSGRRSDKLPTNQPTDDLTRSLCLSLSSPVRHTRPSLFNVSLMASTKTFNDRPHSTPSNEQTIHRREPKPNVCLDCRVISELRSHIFHYLMSVSYSYFCVYTL